MSMHSVLAALSISCALAAQSTLIVDAAGNGNYLDLPPAVAAAQPGDLVLVRAGTYSSTTVRIGIRIVGEPGATVFGGFATGLIIDHVPAGQCCVVRGIGTMTLGGPTLQVLDCLGQVHLEDIAQQTGIEVQRSSQVSLVHISMPMGGVPLHVADSSVAVVRCDLHAGWSVGEPRHAVVVERSTVVLSQTTLVGGPDFTGIGSGSAVALLSGSLIVAGDASTSIAAGTSLSIPQPAPAILGTAGSIVIDPQVQLVPRYGAPAIGGAAAVTTVPVPAVLADVDAQVLSVQTRASAGDLAFVLVGLAPQPLSNTTLGELWLGAGAVVLQSGSVPATGTLLGNVPLPPLPQGLLATFQALIVRGNQVLLSTPSSTTLD